MDQIGENWRSIESAKINPVDGKTRFRGQIIDHKTDQTSEGMLKPFSQSRDTADLVLQISLLALLPFILT